jgi:hypothetical protein
MIIPLLFAAFTGALAPPPSVAAQGSPGVAAVAQAGTPKPDNNPFGKLFGAKPTPKVLPPAQQSRPSAPKPTVMCGLRLFPADPAVDPKMRIDVAGRGTYFTMRSVSPPVCRK